MPWWKRNPGSGLVFSASSSSSSSPSSSPDAARKTGGDGRSWPRGVLFFPWGHSKPRPRLTRQNNLRRLSELEIIEALGLDEEAGADDDTVSWSPSNLASASAVSSSPLVSWSPSNLDAAPLRSASSPILPPRPLPRPGCVVTASLRREFGMSPPNSSAGPLPSPLRELSRTECDSGNGAAADPTSLEPVVASLSTNHTSCKSPGEVDMLFNKSTISCPRKVLQEPSPVGTTNFVLKIPPKNVLISEFSGFTGSPVICPMKTSDGDNFASAFGARWAQVSSTPETPSKNMMTAFSNPTSPERTLRSAQCSPLCSPATKTPIARPRYASAPPSPLRMNTLSESPAAGHDNVHPLPLPPRPAPSTPTLFAHHKTEVRIMRNQWQKGKLIGSGTFGHVYEAINRYDGSLCAMKEVNIIPDDSRSAECLKQLEQEINFLSQLKHPNIVQYYGSEMTEDRLYIYIEHIHPGSINKYASRYNGAMTESVVSSFTRHILQGLNYLHSRKVMHRDIKGANLLVDVNGVVKLADFGVAKHLSGAAPANSVKGSPFWMAPEVLQSTTNKEIGYDLAVDIWSLGCTVIEMFTGTHPWSDLQGQQAMFKVLCYDPPIPKTLSTEAKDFLQRCFRRNPAERPTAKMLLDHPFIQNCHQCSLHGHIQAFSAMKTIENTGRSRNREKSKSCRFVKRKHMYNSEYDQSHSETYESAASRRPTHSIPRDFSCLSPRSSYIPSSPAGSPTYNWNVVQSGAGNLQSYALSKRHGKELVNPF